MYVYLLAIALRKSGLYICTFKSINICMCKYKDIEIYKSINSSTFVYVDIKMFKYIKIFKFVYFNI